MQKVKSKKITSIVALLFLLSSVITLTPQKAFACSCNMTSSPTIELSASTAVFSGKVTRINNGMADQSGYQNKEVGLDVEKVWKGALGSTTLVLTGMDSAMCGYDFKQGEKYFIYAYGDASSLTTSICSGTKLLSEAQNDLSALGSGNSPISQNNTAPKDSPSTANKIIIVLASFAVLFVLYKIYSYRKKHK